METKKLTCRDLMIGDWVNIAKPHKVTGIQICDGIICVQTDYTDTYYSIENYEPIPLTAEILEKNGLKPHRRYIGMFVERTDKYTLYVTESTCSTYILLEDGTEEHNWVLPRPKYLHELQHYIRDFNILKEIVL